MTDLLTKNDKFHGVRSDFWHAIYLIRKFDIGITLRPDMVIGAGKVVDFESRNFTVIAGRTALYRVQWLGRFLPPSVQMGHQVLFAGALRSTSPGNRLEVFSAVVLTEVAKMRKSLLRLLTRHAVKPREYVPESYIEHIRTLYRIDERTQPEPLRDDMADETDDDGEI